MLVSYHLLILSFVISYRATLRKLHATRVEGYRTEFDDFNAGMSQASKDFSRMMDLPADSMELQDLFIKYENWHEESYDPNMVIGKLENIKGS